MASAALSICPRAQRMKLAQPGPAVVEVGAGLVGQEPDAPPLVAWPPVRGGQLDGPPFADDPVEQHVDRQPPPQVVVAEQRPHGVCYRRAAQAGGGRGVVPPAPAGRLPPGEVIVAAPEHGMAQRRDHRDPVIGVIDGLQHRHQVADRVGFPDQGAAHHPVRDVVPLKRVLELAERSAGRDQDRHVGIPRRARLPVPAGDQPSLGLRPEERGRDMRGLGIPDPADRLVQGTAEEQHVRALVAGNAVACRAQVRVAGRPGAGEKLAERRVDHIEDRRPGPEVLHQADPAGFVSLPDGGEQSQFGAAEAVDRLRLVADKEQPATRDGKVLPGTVSLADDQVHELDLQRVSVLEFIDQDRLPAAVHGCPGSRVAAQHPDRVDQQVVEPQGAAAAPIFGVSENGEPEPFQQRGRDSRTASTQLLVSAVAYLAAQFTGPGQVSPVRRQSPAFPHFTRTRVSSSMESTCSASCSASASRSSGSRTSSMCAAIRSPSGPWPAKAARARSGWSSRPRSGAGIRRAERDGWQQVPVGVERLDDLVQVSGFQAERQPHPPGRCQAGIGKPIIQPRPPPPVARDARADRVGDLEGRGKPGFQGPVREQPGREAVQRGDRGVIKPGQRPGAAAAFGVLPLAGGVRGVFKRLADAPAQLGRSVLGEHDRRQRLNAGQPARRYQRDHPFDQLPGLAGASSCVDEQRLAVGAGNTGAGGSVLQICHDPAGAGSARPAYGRVRGLA